MRLTTAILVFGLISGCSGDGGAPADGGATEDLGPDLRGTTPCGTDSCDPATEVCAYHSSRSGGYYICSPIPAGCDQDRSCGCVGADACGGKDCSEEGEPNTVRCWMLGLYMSCPFLYLHDPKSGSYSYHTDLAGSVLGAGVKLFQPQHYAGGYYRLGRIEPSPDGYRMKIRETIHEADYFDAAELLLIDLPTGYSVYNEWSFTSQLGYASPARFFTVKDPRQPIAARDDGGADVLAEVRDKDGVPLPVRLDRFSRVEVDFGPIERPEHAKLILTAWSFYRDLEAEQRPPYSAATTIETRDASGHWVVRKRAGKNPGDRRSWVIDIAGLVSAGDTRMRITMSHQPIGLDVLDQVLLDDSEPVAITALHRVKPATAELRFGGAASFGYASPLGRISAKDDKQPLLDDALLDGHYTRFGDVRPLLEASDDRFVVMAHGDELALRFAAPPKPAAGTERWAYLFADVFYSIKYSVKGQLTTTAEPLPYHGMQRYPYAADESPHAGDASYRRYLARWNTRQIRAPR